MEYVLDILYIGDNGVFGHLVLGDDEFYTVERRWADNAKGRSCIPEGTYTLERHNSRKFGRTFALVNHDLGIYHYPDPNADRAAILLHAANKPSELEGCIAPGLGILKNSDGVPYAVTSSRDALEEVLSVLKEGDRITIQIVEGEI
jgi:hypothetical protein